MCPLCISTAALIVGGVISTGGLAAIVIKKFGVKSSVVQPLASTTSKEDRHG
jgi:hypothetical protein